MVAQAIKTGPAMQRHLEAHGIKTTLIERRRTTGLFHMEVTRDTGVDPAVEFAKRIMGIPGVSVVHVYPDKVADWRPENTILTASLDLAVVDASPVIPVKPVVCDHGIEADEMVMFYPYMGNFGEVCKPVKQQVKPVAQVAEYQVSFNVGHIAVFPCGMPQCYK